MGKSLSTCTEPTPRWTGLQLDLLNACTSKCVYCGYPSWPKVRLAQEVIFSVLVQARELRFTSVSLSGGSPQLHPDFNDTIAMAQVLGMKVNVFTDGIAMKWDRLLARPDRMQFSIDVLDPAVYRKHRGVDKLDEAVNSVWESCRRGIPTRIMSTVIPGDWIESLEVVRFVKEAVDRGLPLDHRLYMVHDYGEDVEPEAKKHVMYMVTEMLHKYGKQPWHNLDQVLGLLATSGEVYRPQRCYIPFLHRVVAADGMIFGCCYASGTNMPWDDIKEYRAQWSLGQVTVDDLQAFTRACEEPPDDVLKEYHLVRLGQACTACSTVNSRYGELNADWNQAGKPAFV